MFPYYWFGSRCCAQAAIYIFPLDSLLINMTELFYNFIVKADSNIQFFINCTWLLLLCFLYRNWQYLWPKKKLLEFYLWYLQNSNWYNENINQWTIVMLPYEKKNFSICFRHELVVRRLLLCMLCKRWDGYGYLLLWNKIIEVICFRIFDWQICSQYFTIFL